MEDRDITQFLEILEQGLLTAAILQEFKDQATLFCQNKCNYHKKENPNPCHSAIKVDIRASMNGCASQAVLNSRAPNTLQFCEQHPLRLCPIQPAQPYAIIPADTH